jgi:SAM-dependent methyltransferase
MYDATQYESWYQTPRGKWISDNEYRLMMRQLDPEPGSTLLDVGCGTGHFSRRFQSAGLEVTGIDRNAEAIAFAREQGDQIEYLEGIAEDLPFAENSFDYCSAVTSLCFVNRHEKAIKEMWRVCRKAVVLGLLNRHSLLFRQKSGHGSYQGARWDTIHEIYSLAATLAPQPTAITTGTAIVLPGGGGIARFVEKLGLTRFPVGGFLSVYLEKQSRELG